MTNQTTPRIETIVGTIEFKTESELAQPYAPENFKKYQFDRDFRGKFLYIPNKDREIFITLEGRIQGESGESSEVEATKMQHEQIKEYLAQINPETEQLIPSAGGYCTILPSRNFIAFFGTTTKYQRGIEEMRDGLVARALNQESGGIITQVLPLKVAPELAKEIKEIRLDENGNPYAKLDFSHLIRRLRC
jgi:hypothetical protein